jgi:hypothetical protein
VRVSFHNLNAAVEPLRGDILFLIHSLVSQPVKVSLAPPSLRPAFCIALCCGAPETPPAPVGPVLGLCAPEPGVELPALLLFEPQAFFCCPGSGDLTPLDVCRCCEASLAGDALALEADGEGREVGAPRRHLLIDELHIGFDAATEETYLLSLAPLIFER